MSDPVSDSRDVSQPPDRLTLRGFRYRGFHGWYDQERVDGNSFEVDLVVTGWFRASRTLGDVPDYERMERRVRAVMEQPGERLLERLCERIGEAVMDELRGGIGEGGALRFHSLEVRVRKVPPPIETPCEHAEISLTWLGGGGG